MPYGKDYLNITVLPDTKNRINNYGKKGETYDQILNRIFDVFDTVDSS